MTFADYQEVARSTAIYPTEHAVTYPALGLCGEAGEVAEKVKKWLRDDSGEMTNERRDAIAKELGDCLWYVSNLCSDLGLTLENVAAANVSKLLGRKERGQLKGDGDDR